MISLDQVLLLQQKVESAVTRIAELNQAVAHKDAEIAALRSKCVELTNALSAKTEQFSSFQTDQSKIEEGILKALERLNAVESTVLSVAAQAAQPAAQTAAEQPLPAPEVSDAPHITEEQPVMQPPAEETISAIDEGAEMAFDEGSSITPDISFDDANPSPAQPDGTSQGQFDIF